MGIDCIEQKEPLTATGAIHRPKLQCCRNETLPIYCCLPFLSFSVVLPSTLLFDSTRSVGLCSAPPAVLWLRKRHHYTLFSLFPLITCLNAVVQHRHALHNVLCRITTSRKAPPIPFSLAVTSIKKFSQVVAHTVPGCPTPIYIFFLSLCS